MSNQKTFIKMTPRDLLFCRDAKPMEQSWAGNGGLLPAPSTLHGAVLAAYFRKYPAELNNQTHERNINSLTTQGPFLYQDGMPYFSTPLDVMPENKLLKLQKITGYSDLPQPLQYALFVDGKPSKKSVEPYISLADLQKYLQGKEFELKPEFDFFIREARPGITIKSDSRTAQDGKYYFAEYLRLRENTSLIGTVDANDTSDLEKVFSENSSGMILGGQQSLVYVDTIPVLDLLPAPQISGRFVKYVLLTPAAWNKGWLPEFVDAQSQEWNVLLKSNDGPKPERRPGELRAAYRKRLAAASNPIRARLIAAKTGKPIPISGWKLRGTASENAKMTYLYIPAGSVYYFEAADEQEAQRLATALHGRAMSTMNGTAGYGLGVCGTFNIEDNK